MNFRLNRIWPERYRILFFFIVLRTKKNGNEQMYIADMAGKTGINKEK